MVWPLPSSLATTKGIEFSFFSSGYLDVSLPRVPSVKLFIHLTVTGHYPSRVSPFGYLWIKAYLRLPKAFRSLSRPSSAISALASTLRSSSLDLCLPAKPPPKTTFRIQQGSMFCVYFASSIMPFRSRSRSASASRSLELHVELYLFRIESTFSLSSSHAPHALLQFPSFLSLCSFQGASGGLEWTRTTDLSLIRRVL